MRVTVAYTIRIVIKDHKVSISQHIGALLVQLGVKIMDAKTSYTFEEIKR